MSNHTKILVLHSKTLVYTILLLASLLIFAIIIKIMLGASSSSAVNSTSSVALSPDSSYVPGVYSSPFNLGSYDAQLTVYLDGDHINNISIQYTDESIATMYPLVETTLAEIAAQIVSTQNLSDVSYSSENRYTSILLLNTIYNTIQKAK